LRIATDDEREVFGVRINLHTKATSLRRTGA
jgi:hypothetical protein